MAKTTREVEIGKLYGKWTVLSGPSKGFPSQRTWLCRCACGVEKQVRGRNLLLKISTQCNRCGTKGKRKSSPNRLHVQLGITRKLSNRLQCAVRSAIHRCTIESDQSYNDYGGRGITVYADWIGNTYLFVQYLLMLPGHDDPMLVLDRIDNDKGYEPGNLRFVTWSVSNLNKRVRSNQYRSKHK